MIYFKRTFKKVLFYHLSTGHQHTQLQGAKDATCQTEGYTGDLVCTDCGTLLQTGTVIEKTAHHYENGVCTVCGAHETAVPGPDDGNSQPEDTKPESSQPQDNGQPENGPSQPDKPDDSEPEATVPATGDTTAMGVWLIGFGGAGVLGVILLRRQKKA